MKKAMAKRVLSLTLAGAMTAGLIAGCGSKAGSSGSTDTSNEKYPETLTIDVFDSQANFQGVQTGWFAKIVKDKFNMELNIIAPNVAGGGDTLYQTRSANGNLGDLIITNLDNSRLKDLVTAGLVLDMTDYIGTCEHLMGYEDVIKNASSLAETDGIWAVPSEISNQSATEPCEATEPTNAPSIRWDLYGEVGYPEIGTLEDLIPVLGDMQDAARAESGDQNTYAISLFKDWDGDVMQNAGALCALYGYESMGFVMSKADGSEAQSVIDEDGIYVRALRFLYEANQAGIVDPESTTQNFDTLQSKYKDGKVLYSLWPWLGAGQYNTSDNTAAGKGGSCGPEGLTWEMKDGEPVLTDFGVQAFVDINADLAVPDEWGGGTWKDGVSTLNMKTVGVVDTDPDNGICYNYQRWDDYQQRVATKLSEDWSAQNDGALSAIEELDSKGRLLVLPGTDYATPEYTTDISTIKEQCKQTIVEYSWKMVFASDDADFEAQLAKMQETAKGLGYDEVLAVDKQNSSDKAASIKELLAK